jgi:magnesium-dependent phosphatase-1
MSIKLVVFDCDNTLWDHDDVSTLRPPFRKVDDRTVADARGELVRLTPGARETLETLRRRGVMVSIASWNRPEPAFAIFELLDLRKYFTHPKVEFHPHKDRMIAALLAELATDGIVVGPEEILFVDDRPEQLSRVRDGVGPVRILQTGVDLTDLRHVVRVVDEAERSE